ncbi:hypothetical protein V2I78_19750 [Pseudomonas viridiflava]|uniref:hypothetical protein n=1 Tax=Pseudomonas viridiflava TaxID=33069 RepID=UPI002EA0E176|nr:hypothetical protein [Pseudomonas viridiflava]
MNDYFWPIAAFREGQLVVNRSREINQDQAQSGRSRPEHWAFAVLRTNPIGLGGGSSFVGLLSDRDSFDIKNQTREQLITRKMLLTYESIGYRFAY